MSERCNLAMTIVGEWRGLVGLQSVYRVSLLLWGKEVDYLNFWPGEQGLTNCGDVIGTDRDAVQWAKGYWEPTIIY